ncbi:potassium transporter TrkA [bacterium]|nr:MAG: potassium transporter TrkA [bacterium]
MTNVKETALPGVGVRHEFKTKSGDRLGTILHRSGRRDLLIFSQKDPDACARAIRLDDEDADTLADLLGSESNVQKEQDKVRGEIGGLTLDWLPIEKEWKCSGVSIADTRIFDETGVVVVAVMRYGEPIPTPDGNFRLRGGDVAIVVGAPEGIERAQGLLQSGFCG